MTEKITGKDNPRLTAAGKLKLKKYRDEKGAFIISGKKLAEEALSSGIVISEVFFTDEFLNKDPGYADRFPSIPAYSIPSHLSKKLCDEDAPEGVFCVCRKPGDRAPGGGFTLICERVSDPGNIGTILRSARAFGANVILSSDCADIYSPKVLRAAMGAVFSVNVSFSDDMTETVKKLKQSGYRVYAAALHTDAAPLSQTELSGKCAVAVGSEGRGLTKETIDACDGCVLIEMEPSCESLNVSVAASLIMYHAYKK